MQSDMPSKRELGDTKSTSSGVVLGRALDLLSNLPKFHDGGTVPKDGAYQLQEGEQVIPVDDAQPDAEPEEKLADGESVNLRKSYSRINASLTKLFDANGIRRAFTVPYAAGEQMHEHMNTVAQAAQQAGGLVNNFITTSHRADGKGWGSEDGETVGHSADKLAEAKVPKNDPNAIAAIDAAKKLVADAAKLLGKNDPAILKAKSVLKLLDASHGERMSLIDFGVAMINLPVQVLQEIARQHSGTKSGGHSPALRAPRQ